MYNPNKTIWRKGMEYFIDHIGILIVVSIIIAAIGIALQYVLVNNANTKRKKIENKEKK